MKYTKQPRYENMTASLRGLIWKVMMWLYIGGRGDDSQTDEDDDDDIHNGMGKGQGTPNLNIFFVHYL